MKKKLTQKEQDKILWQELWPLIKELNDTLGKIIRILIRLSL